MDQPQEHLEPTAIELLAKYLKTAERLAAIAGAGHFCALQRLVVF